MKEGFIAFFKILFFLLILPLIFAVTVAFQTQVLGLPASKEAWLLWGAVFYVAINLFFYDFKEVYAFGQQVTSKALGFLAPVVGVVGYIVPVYAIIVVLVKVILSLFGKSSVYEGYFLFAASFSWAMHLIMTAREIHQSDNSPLKAQYFFGFGVVYTLNLFVAALLLMVLINEFSILTFINALAHHTYSIYKSAYHLLFVDS